METQKWAELHEPSFPVMSARMVDVNTVRLDIQETPAFWMEVDMTTSKAKGHIPGFHIPGFFSHTDLTSRLCEDGVVMLTCKTVCNDGIARECSFTVSL